MKIVIYITVFILTFSLSKAQVGINTETPQATLHVNGDLQVGKSIHVGGDDKTAGNPGKQGQFLASQGVNNPPVWKSIAELDVPLAVGFAYRSSNTASYNANTSPSISFPTSAASHFYNNPEYITYNTGNSRFTIQKSGYYNITAYVRYTNSSSSDGISSTIIDSSDGSIGIVFNTYGTENTGSQNQTIDTNTSQTAYLEAGTEVWLTGSYSRNFQIPNASLSFMYVGA